MKIKNLTLEEIVNVASDTSQAATDKLVSKHQELYRVFHGWRNDDMLLVLAGTIFSIIEKHAVIHERPDRTN